MIRHHWYDQQDLQSRPLNRELLTNAKYAGVQFIYPNLPLEQCLGGRERGAVKGARKPRHLQLLGAEEEPYFGNQDAAVDNF